MFTRETRHGSFSIRRALRPLRFVLASDLLFILKSSEIYYRRINQERRATCFMSLEVSRGAGGGEEQGEDINVNNNSLIT